ncbi:N-formylglutamate amidohydrolase [Sphingomonas piscis]|uniref:N-formylglutamate amidohydrolase n=1 Tax=Sphingomonas piscis TaxID=2714943 RepID=A0A6G7YRS9_9SPHN|nr:N-formylglutamate amidohydrolase [Sphingomonas piscis]QIK79446.1 N-formylglutamate amidohydrolase [Sphingomonas piscis]
MSSPFLPPPIIHHGRGDLPVLLSVPHSGRDYPDWLLDLATQGFRSLSSLEDPFVDRLVWRAMQHGVGAVIARTPRAAVDCNRAENEIDPSVVEGGSARPLTARARGGLGIVPGRTQQHGYLWRRPIRRHDLEKRLDAAHRPYHQAVEDQLELILQRFGCALLLDCHSMPPPPAGTPPIVFGDCHGRTAADWLTREAEAVAAHEGFAAQANEPFAGGYVVERHGAPGRNVHAIQVEIDRRCYLDERLREPADGFDDVARLLEALTVELGSSLLRRQFAVAAE